MNRPPRKNTPNPFKKTKKPRPNQEIGICRFDVLCPEIAHRETRSITLPQATDSLPAGSYAFIEFYCTDPECDCRKVTFQVWSKEHPGRVLATISYGWESEDYYTGLLNDRDHARDIVSGSLDPLNPQSIHADALLELFQDILLNDAAYIERLQRHYDMVCKRSGPAT